MARIAAAGGVVAEVDCTSADVHDGPSLARAILGSLRSRGIHLSRMLEARAAAAQQRGRRAAPVADKAGVDADVVDVFDRVLEAMSSGHEPTLDDVLAHLAQLSAERTIGLFLDELQRIGTWTETDAVQEALARFMRYKGRTVAVVVAGSEESATKALFAEGQPLHWEFEAFDLPPIDRIDWHQGIHERFKELGLQIAAARIDQVLDATGGHPLRTMAVAKQTVREARDASESDVGWGTVSAAIEKASKHPSWRA
jgi:hypothetical protein